MLAEATAAVTATIRDRFLADHRRLEALLEQLLAAVEANDRDAMTRLWTQFDSSLLAHLEAEERYLFPALFRVCDRDARVLGQEHRHIRSRLAELGVGIDLHTVRLDSTRDFIDELRAHARNEDRLLYQWGDAHLDEPQRMSAIAGLSAGLHAQAKNPAT
jgi:hypothetical protein